ncbi:alkanesulfonate monooxygenase [Parafrankia colletiae]|uniref:Alkanesulfonate monooxygenase n=1 Tax=Parafrankia colletiae TaxID=573497 RepID=A0A1S1QFB7_9ACTN|nr:LLM class flavin-dependent oxidoreductase [Parafrankia colletiae]MCK9903114.1 LLM class flavin-dependent oxidoreductase [Frankia sp. Cpl3]OHV30974.1 alkanesulfonate monooxygenase [Parafrankia colletiae]
MSLTFHWFLPTSGDARDVVAGGHGAPAVATTRGRPPTLEYLGQIARAAEQLGFVGALTPTGSWCEDAWLTTAMLVETTRRLKFLVAVRPGFVSPTLTAQMASTYQRLSGGRLLLNVVTGGEADEQESYGDFLNKEERYARCDEYLTVLSELWQGRTVDRDGRFVRLRGAKLSRLPDPPPEIYFGGSSPPAIAVAARHADVYLTWGEPPDAVAAKFAEVRAAAEVLGRRPRFGLRAHVISRDSADEAWAAADRLISGLDPAAIATAQARLAHSDSEGQRRMLALHNGSAEKLEIHPNLWAGVGLIRGGAGTAFVGSHEEVADLIGTYRQAGVSEFVLSGYPHLEEAYWFGEGVLPILRARGQWEP